MYPKHIFRHIAKYKSNTKKTMDQLVTVFKALSDKNRLRILAALTQHNELCACQLIELLQVAGATTSNHLGVLVRAGFLKSRKEGRWVYYRLVDLKGANREVAALSGLLKKELLEIHKGSEDEKLLKIILKSNPEEICRKQRQN